MDDTANQINDPGIELLIAAQEKDLGEMIVRRTLPSRERQRVGPFIFFDHMGPVDFPPGSGVSVRPHPHIGIATLTYLFEGEIIHRDSLGCVQSIRPGAVNWMTAGRGIVHSERSSEEMMASGSRLHGIQTWLALPLELEETDPAFVHYEAGTLPMVERPGVTVRVIVGEALEQRSPVVTASETLYLEVDLSAGVTLTLNAGVDELAVYAAVGQVRIGDTTLSEGTMVVLDSRVATELAGLENAKAIVLGGATLAGERHLYWNLVSSRRQRLEQAKDDWRNGRFDQVPGDTEFMPLPD